MVFIFKKAPVAVKSDVKMGESEDAKEYDQERIFTHLCVFFVSPILPTAAAEHYGTYRRRCFYLDSPANAAKHGIPVKPSKHEKDIATK